MALILRVIITFCMHDTLIYLKNNCMNYGAIIPGLMVEGILGEAYGICIQMFMTSLSAETVDVS